MKTLMQITRLSFILLVIVALNACKKSDDTNPDGGSKGAGSYTYLGSSTNTTRGDYLQTDGSTYVFVYGQQPTDIVQIIFTKVSAITAGTYTYKVVGNGYDPAKNFSGGAVTTAAQPAGVSLTGGTVTVSKEGEGFAIAFDCSTAAGALKGTYTGTFISR